MKAKENNFNGRVLMNSRRKLLRQVGLGSLFLGTLGHAHGKEYSSVGKSMTDKTPIWDPYEYGAKGDGMTLDSEAIQATIDACHERGGGKVVLHSGTFVSGTIILRSNICLHVEAGATLLGSRNIDDYPEITPSLPYLYTHRFVKYLIFAEKVENISISGQGTIDGNGHHFPYIKNEDKNRPYILRFSECKNVTVRDITLQNSARWVQHYLACENVNIQGITVNSPTRENRDGINIDSCNKVRITNCSVDSGDDSIVLKATTDRLCQNVTVSNCVMRSKASTLKLGTESNGGFKNILFTNCSLYGDTNGDAIALEMVDGGTFENVTVSNITIQDARNALFIRLGNRARPIPGMGKPGKGTMKNLTLDNIQATGISNWGCSITGLPDQFIENLTLSNIRIEFAGKGTVWDAELSIPEKPAAYPNSKMYGMLPVYGFFCRHIRNLMFTNINLDYLDEDARPALYCENIIGMTVVGFNAKIDKRASAFFVLKNVKESMIRGCRPSGSSKAFLALSGSGSENISLFQNDLTKCEKPIIVENGLDKEVLLANNIGKE